MSPTSSSILAVLSACLAGCTVRDPLGAETGTSTGMSTSTSGTPDTSDAPSTGASTPTTSGDPATSTSGGTTTQPDPDSGTAGTSTGGIEPSTGPGDATTIDSTATTGDDGGATCLVNADCATRACLEFRDHDPAATCVEAPAGGNTRFPGTLLDFVTGAPLPATDVKIIGMLSALSNANNMPGLVAGTSDAAGIVDMTSTSPVSEGIAVVAVVSGGALYTTCTTVAAPMEGVYGPMSEGHDLWGVPSAALSKWSVLLATEPTLAEHLPLGDNGGIVGLVRDSTGAPVANAVVQSVKPGSAAEIRYLAADGSSFGADGTSSNGVFVILGAGLAERFEVAGAPAATETAGTAEKTIFVMTLDML